MQTTDISYIELLGRKLEILDSIYENTVGQFQALKSKDDILLGKLLKKRQKQIAGLESLHKASKAFTGLTRDDEIIKAEQSIAFLQKEISSLNALNMKTAEKDKMEAAKALGLLKNGRNAVLNGYYKKPEQRYGYFVDKRVGK